MDKLSLTERDICTKFILPAVKRAGWDEMVKLTQSIRSQSNADGQASKW
jgi:type I restriction enzyme, R subunit